MKRLRKWQIVTHGSCFITNRSLMSRWITVTPLCSSSQRFCPIRNRINTFMKQWWSFLGRFYRMLSIRQTSRNLRRRLTVSSDQMLSIFHSACNLKNREKESSLSLWILLPKRLTLKWSNAWSSDSRFQSKSAYYDWLILYRESYRQSYLRAKTEIRPLFTRLTPHGAVQSRSPLVSMIFPSLKDKTKIFQE